MKMTNKSNLQVPFSKRRSGVLKKASELCTLCGAERLPPHDTQFMGVNLHELNAQLTKFTTQLETEKKRASELKRLHQVVQIQWWWAAPVNEMSISQLNECKGALQQMKMNTTRKSEMILIHTAINYPTLFFRKQ
ncbi:Agamous-like MADS-box protein AGL62 [Glycine soja]|uniref:Agamous-like MADS-box protein AGL62 n=1 Tax=Glycine soja TaxID=3848 RepID=A0A445M687_GLYSO|nr:hypothetical protein JHK87_002458 [Glycine soja]KAH1267454.1 Agamous-like MADS-box protein AGL62 [Glycine max]KHN42718.1 Agamous-like MADS-box protein AGL62 [Glycine soja]RZC31096.1 Agamous-like MADS-box protein AGL62 [Glycine soja]